MSTSTGNPYVTVLSTKSTSTTSFPNLPNLQDGLPAGMQRIIIPPNSLLTPHIHPDTNETTFCLAGTGKVGLIVPNDSQGPIGGLLKESDFAQNSVVFLPQGFPHYFRNTGTENMELLLTFENFHFNIITLADIFQQFDGRISASAFNTTLTAASSPIIEYLANSHLELVSKDQ